MKWQPIETAPSFLLILVTTNVKSADKNYRQEPALAYWNGKKWARLANAWQPTHWMPLPDPPA
jgi:hypothetical protein